MLRAVRLLLPVFVALSLPLAPAAARPVLVGAGFTLRERGMLGDTGSNLVGALAGVSLLVTLDDTARIVALAIVGALNVYGEFRSISGTIERVPLLRSLDSLGRVDQGPPDSAGPGTAAPARRP